MPTLPQPSPETAASTTTTSNHVTTQGAGAALPVPPIPSSEEPTATNSHGTSSQNKTEEAVIPPTPAAQSNLGTATVANGSSAQDALLDTFALQLHRSPTNPNDAVVRVDYSTLTGLQQYEATNSPNMFDLPQPSASAQVTIASYSRNSTVPKLTTNEVGSEIEISPPVQGTNRLSVPEMEGLFSMYRDSISSVGNLSVSNALLVNSKNVSNEVINLSTQAAQPFKNFVLRNRSESPVDGELTYPLLCIYGKGEVMSHRGETRIAQAVLTALLREALHRQGYPMEIPARQGFGSLFPTTADVRGGVRLSFGMLPPKYAPAVVTALNWFDEFLTEFPSYKETMRNTIDNIDGYSSVSDKNLSLITNSLIRTNFSDLRGAPPNGVRRNAAIRETLIHPNNTRNDMLPVYRPQNGQMASGDTFEIPGGGYPEPGIDASSWAPQTPPKQLGRQNSRYYRQQSSTPGMDAQTIYTSSGMHSIQAADYAAGKFIRDYRAHLESNNRDIPPEMNATAHRYGAYFEADPFLDREGCCLVDRAGEPANERSSGSIPDFTHQVHVEDATNLSVLEQNEIIERFRNRLRGEDDARLLVFVKSQSKWAGFGDSVMGQMHIYGNRKYVNNFSMHVNHMLQQQQRQQQQQGYSAVPLGELKDRKLTVNEGAMGTRTGDILNTPRTGLRRT